MSGKVEVYVKNLKVARGFTLPEVLTVIALLSLLTVLSLGATGPWLAFRAQTESDNKLQSVRNSVAAYYEALPWTVNSGAANTFGPLSTSAVADGVCNDQSAALASLSVAARTALGAAGEDPYKRPLCVFVTNAFQAVAGTFLHSRVIAIVSTGVDGVLDADTELTGGLNFPQIALRLGGDDRGVVFDTRGRDMERFNQLQDQMARIAKMYEVFFTSRYLASTTRSMTVNYFAAGSPAGASITDVGNPIPLIAAGDYLPTTGAQGVLGVIGVENALATIPWPDAPVRSEVVQIGNNRAVGALGAPISRTPGVDPGNVAIGDLPYTALLRARLPFPPGGATNSAGGQLFVYRTVVGGY